MRRLHPCHLESIEREYLGAELSPADAARVILQALGRGEADVRAVEVDQPGAEVRRVHRRRGESLDALVNRARPAGYLVAPIFVGEADETADGRAVRQVIGRCVRLVQIAPA